MAHEINGKFKPLSKRSLSELASYIGTDSEEGTLNESDLCFQDGDTLYQFKYVKPEKEQKYTIEPGIFTLIPSNVGLTLGKTEFKERKLLESVTSTSIIMKEAHTFFKRLDRYIAKGKPLKRGILLYSAPGFGKSSAIEKVCRDLIAEDAGTVVVVWPTSDVEADEIIKFLSIQSEYTPECTRMVLVIEDIGGGERDGYRGRNPVDSGLLNLLDGIGVIFKLPTLFLATTNHPENLLASLADRPGRFDLMLKLNAPNAQEKIALMEFIAKRALTEEEKIAITQKGTEEFSIAHLEEIDTRADLHDKSYAEVVKELLEHKKMFDKEFVAGKSRGVGIGMYD